MEPFSISCTTCQARLRVRDPSAIGQILTCPKCGSMVLIEAPVPGASESSSSSSIGQASAKSPATPPPLRPTDFADTVEDPTHYGTVKSQERPPPPASPPSSVSPPPAAATTPHEAVDEPRDNPDDGDDLFVPDPEGLEDPVSASELAAPLTDDEWLQAASRQRQRWALAALALIAGIGLAISVFVYIAGRGASENLAQADAPGQVEPIPSDVDNAAQLPTPSDASLGPGATSDPMNGELGTNDPAAGADNPNPSMPAPEVLPAPPMAEPISPAPAADNSAASPSVPSDASLPPPSTTSPLPDPAVATNPPPPGPPVIPMLPEDVKPTPGDPTLAKPSPDEPTPAVPPDLAAPPDDRSKADRVASGGTLNDTLRRLGGLFDEPDAVPEEETSMPPATASVVEEPGPDAPKAAGPSRPPEREIDFAARMSDRIAEVEFRETPLQDVLHFVMTFSTIPVSLDPDVLVWMNLTPRTPVTAKLTKTSVSGLLEQTLSPIGLIAIPVDDQLFVTRRPVGDGALRKAQRKVDDLVGSDPAAVELIRSHLLQLVAPESWSAAGGPGTVTYSEGALQLEQSDQVMLEVSSFLERLRVARGLPKLSKFDVRLFQPVTKTTRAASKLDQPITLNFSRPTPFTRIVRRLSEEGGVSLLINWRSLAELGWTPDTETTLIATEQPLRETLQALLEPMELSYRVVDEAVFQIAALSAIEEKHEIEFYPVGDLLDAGKSADELVSALREALADGAGPSATIQFDTPSRCLIALLPQPQQQLVEQRLLEWKTAGK